MAFFHVQRPTEVPKFAAAPQQRFSQGVWKSLDFLAKKVPERFPNWKFEDVFYGCLILVLVNDFAHMPWADSPNFQKNAHNSNEFPYINCWFSRFLGYLPGRPVFFFFRFPISMATEIQIARSPRHHKWLLGGVHLANLQW